MTLSIAGAVLLFLLVAVVVAAHIMCAVQDCCYGDDLEDD